MLTYIVRRLFAAVGLLLVVTLATFFIFYILPQWGGETIQEMARQYVGRTTTPQALQAVIERLGFDKPFFVQYFDYVKGIVVGTQYNDGASLVQCNAPCLGYSFRNYTPVLPTILQYFPVTLSIVGGGAVLWLGFGVLSGVISAVRKGSFVDRFFMGISLTGVSLPVYFIGPLAALVLAYNNSILPVPNYTSIGQSFGSWFGGMIIPWFVLAFSYAALYTRLTRGGMLDAMNEDYTRTARAKGLSERKVIFKHALRAAIIPIVTIFGMDLGGVLGGAVLVEKSLSLNGIGALAINSIQNQDFPTVMGVTLFGAAFIILANLVVDVLYATLDPRVRVS
jgi:peptide/nickel transport system permease protein